ncbi:MAG: hypothetical protein IKM97_06100 [Clostridia bacterium]|nr:hypothetical protein [Clostridia bacterium]
MVEYIPIFKLLIVLLVGIMILFFGLYVYLAVYSKQVRQKKSKEEVNLIEDRDNTKKEEKKIVPYGRFQGELDRKSIFEFMEFDEIVDDMIVRKNGTQYIMVLQCNGVNYDLMSEQEKISVEEGFVQFLNTLRFPVQLYIQSRTLNLKDIIDDYKSRVDSLASEIDKVDIKIAQANARNNKALVEKLEFEKRRKINVLEYGIDITDYVEKLSSNKNVLQQRTYVIVSYYSAEIGGNIDRYSKEEIYNMCFSELYTRCQNIASSLGTSEITSKILDSEELSELLYIAYNRDESEILNLNKIMNAQYDALYSTSKDVLQKKQEKLDQEINIAAIDIATDSILRADKLKQIEDIQKMQDKVLRNDKIKERALDLLDSYEEQLNPRVFELAKEEVNKHKALENNEEKEEKEDTEKETIKKASTTVRKKIVRRKKTEE